MPREQIADEYQFSEEATTTVIEVDGNGSETTLFDEDDGGVTVDLKQKEAKAEPAPKQDDIEIEIVDDTPAADKNRTASPPPDDPTEEELGEYSEKVQKRIKKFTKGYHDERRAKESAERELAEATSYTQKLLEENQRLREQGTKNQTLALEQAKRAVDGDLVTAQREFREAHDRGDTDALLEAQQKLNVAQNRKERLSQIRLPSLQEGADGVQRQAIEQQTTQPQPQADPKAVAWSENNEWFGDDEEMTAFAYGYHQKLLRTGVDPSSDEYYEKLDTRMRQVFPDNFDDVEDEISPKGKKSLSKSEDVVAPATRSQSPKRVKLTQTQVRLAKRLGVPLEMYAKQVAEEQRKQSNG